MPFEEAACVEAGLNGTNPPGTADQSATTAEDNLRRIDAVFEAREQMLEFNVPPMLALESMMVALQVDA